jgi:poly(hydroxyalkanoate) depolymerase family esterase
LKTSAHKPSKKTPWYKRLANIGVSWRSRIKARLIAWRDRWRKVPQNDNSHIFHAKGYPGSLTRHYVVHVPRAKLISQARPLVVVLHGCRQNNRDIQTITDFNRLSDRYGFIVAYPFITSYRGLRFENCWGWWFDREIHGGAGEVEDLWQIVEDIKLNYSINERRIHVTGLSSGAGMAVAMMVAHADKIASGSAVAGVPYAEKQQAVQHIFNKKARNKPIAKIAAAMRAEMGEKQRTVPLKIVHSRDDKTLDIQSAQNLRDSWGECFSIDTSQPYTTACGRTGSADWEYNVYRDTNSNPVIETLFLDGPGHGWYGGNPGDFSYPDGPVISDLIWKFFKAHPLKN